MGSDVRRELWLNKESGECWAVEVSGDQVTRSCGPLDPGDVDPRIVDYLPYRDTDARWVEDSREEFVRYPVKNDPDQD